MMAILIKATGFFLSLLPYKTLELLTECLGELFISFPSARRRILFSNLHHALPHRSYDEIKRIARESAARMFEMGFFSLCYPFLGHDKLRRSMVYSNDAEEKIRKLRVEKKPVILMLPHLSLFETLATSPHFRPQGGRRLGAIYRPNKNKALDRWINSARLNVGIEMFSREAGFSQTREFLKKGNWLVILFDQNAGNQGTLSLFLDRVSSVTTLPDLLQKATKARAVYVCPKRISFFRSKIEFTELERSHSIALDSHDTLADQINNHPNGFPEWLWSHSKWKTHYYPEERFNLHSKRSLISASNVQPVGTRMLIRMPNWLGDIMMALPIIRAIRKARPDMRITLLCQSKYLGLLKMLGVGNHVEEVAGFLSIKGVRSLLKLRKSYPECHLLFTNSLRGDAESLVIGAPQRFGMQVGDKFRPFLTDKYKIDVKRFEGRHLCETWEKMVNLFGLDQKVTYEPFKGLNLSLRGNKIGIILGSSNNSQKRWKIDYWIGLIKLIQANDLNHKVSIYGTGDDSDYAEKILMTLGNSKIHDLTGKTEVHNLLNEFGSCSVVIGCDSGGTHLANALGVATIVIFGPTNPINTRPFYDAKVAIVQPKNSPPQGGLPINEVLPTDVFSKLQEFSF
jgi:heptosyltransferase II